MYTTSQHQIPLAQQQQQSSQAVRPQPGLPAQQQQPQQQFANSSDQQHVNLKAIIEAAQLRKQRGSTEANDPEFARLIAILRQHSSSSKNATSQHPSVPQISPPQPMSHMTSQQGTPLAQPTSSSLPATGNVIPQWTTSQTQHPVQPSQFNAAVSNPSNGSVPVLAQGSMNAAHPGAIAPFTPEQLTALKMQIYVFKLISNNKPVPDNLREKIFDVESFKLSQPSQPVTEASIPTIPGKVIDGTFKNHQQLQQPEQQQTASAPTVRISTARFEIGPLSNPYALLPKRLSSQDLAKRVIIPAATPTGIDPHALIEEREKRVRARIAYRMNELENMPSNLCNDNGLKLRALIELKSLKLLDKQKRLRSELVECLTKSTTLSTAADRSVFRRMKKQSLREAKQTEKLEKNQRLERERREQQKHQDFLQSILQHGREMLNFHKQQQNRCIRLGQAVSKFHAIAQKEEEKRQQRISQERLNALKANDEAAYLRLVDKAKDNRIMHLLHQTESYLKSLTKAMEDQKASVVEQEALDETNRTNGEPDERDYYDTAHRISEVVTEQPSILVGGKLKDYQIKGLQWMVSLYNNRLNGILADEMGLGKTIQTISLITYLIEKKKQNGPFLVIVPLSTITNWDLEFERWAPSVNRIVFKGTVPERQRMKMEVKQGNFHVVVTTYEYIIREKALLAKTKWVYMIIDEGHRMKNTHSKLSTTLVQYYSTRYRLILTGTPLQNNLPELWALLNFTLPKIFNSVETFDEWFNHPFAKEGGKETDIKLNEEESLLIIRGLHKVLRPFLLRRLKKDVESELPDKVETVVKCPMSALQYRLYEQIRSKKSSFGGDGTARRKALNNLVMQFRKVCNHPYVFEDVENTMNPTKATDDNLWRVAGKFELLDRILPKFKVSGHRVLMFFQMTQVMDIMEDYLRMRAHHYLRLDGHTKAEDRTTMLKIFNRPDDPPFIFLLSTRAGGLGLNLQTADTVVIFDSDWNPHQDLQAQDRAHRIGQTKEVRILRLITARSVEETILARAQYKLDIDGKVIQAGKFDHKTTDRERDELLRSLFGSEEDDDEKDETEGQMDDAELNEIIARNEDELELFAKMDMERNRRELEEWRRAGRRGNPPPRLMQDDELPAIYLAEESEAIVEQELDLGRGARARKEVRYDDGLNDDQFLAALDTGDLEGYIERRAVQRAKRAAKRNVRPDSVAEDDNGIVEDDAPEEEEDRVVSTPQPENGKRKRGRPPKKLKFAEAPEDEQDEPAKKKGRKVKVAEDTPKRRQRKFAGVDPDEVDPLPGNLRKALRRVFHAAYEAVEGAEVEYDEGYRRHRCELFKNLPHRQSYPDYYKLIKSPIALDMIKHRMTHAYYKSLEDFVSDFHLMFANAMQYNLEGSEVYNDAVEMKDIFDAKIAELCPGGHVQVHHEDDITSDHDRKRKRSVVSAASDDEDMRLSGSRGRSNAGSDDEDTRPKSKKKIKRDTGVPGLENRYGTLPKIKMRIPIPQHKEEGSDENLEDGEIME
ncbi:SNF2 family N-terminal domain-containing protein [Gaertneriomyces semiglobifer]|nr:SNF2 family N-terminal domain-containing protein [Gaertneriomyces semiglobifer]